MAERNIRDEGAMHRRQTIRLIAGTVAAASASLLAGRAEAKIARVGIIDDGPDWDAFRQELHELNYVEGQNITLDYRRADGIPDRLAVAARELAQIPVDVIAVYGTPAAQAAKNATRSIPIVVIAIGDLAAAGLVANFAQPGGNLTGNTALGPDVVTKRLQVLRDAIPAVSRLALLWNPNNVSSAALLDELWRTTPFFGMSLTPYEARTADDFPKVFTAILSNRPDGAHHQRLAASDEYGTGDRVLAQEPDPRNVSAAAQCRRRRADVLRYEPARPVSARRPLCRQDSPWRKTRRASDRAAGFVRACR
jgi:putative tryptophan/tyrosine transport system substrate-binding protein